MKKMHPKTREAKEASRRHEHEAESGVGGAIAGAAIGAIAGPAGALAGAVIGGVVAAIMTSIEEASAAHRTAIDRELDEEIRRAASDTSPKGDGAQEDRPLPCRVAS